MRRGFALVLAAALAGCGGTSGTLTLDIVVSPVDDPFVTATQVRVSVEGDGGTSQTFAVSSGHFDVKLDQKPNSQTAPVLVEALDSSGNVIAYGLTAPILIEAMDMEYAVFVGRPGHMAQAASSLPSARSEMASAAVPNLGLLVAGGRDGSGTVLSDAAVYDVRTQAVIDLSPMTQARAGGSAAALTGDTRSVVFGGATSTGLGTFGSPVASSELFDPTEGTGLWAPLSAVTTDARSFADATNLSTGITLITGGAAGDGTPLGSAIQITGDATPALSALPPMVAPRLGHAVAPATFPDGPGAIIFGGLAAGSSLSNAERLMGQAFLPYTIPNQNSRVGATATALPDGTVFIVGGQDSTGVLNTGFVVRPDATPTVTFTGISLSSPRIGHSATLVNNDILVCGGADNTGALVQSCDLVDGMTFGVKDTQPLAFARRNHAAGLLISNNVVIAGGLGPTGAPLDSIEIYTPQR